jgi:RimJ/RimL family protein N-acetyltransferase
MRLIPFSAAALPLVEPWFDDEDTCRWLGDRHWPAMVLRMAANPPREPRGDRPRTVARQNWLFEEDAAPVALLDVEAYDNHTAGCAFVVDPAHRRRGCARRALQALMNQVAPTGIRELFAGVEHDNTASIHCLEGAGFIRRSNEPDAEGFLYFARTTGPG